MKQEEIRSSYFLPNISAYHPIEEGEVNAESPSNIALVKYWGKKEIQIPANSSLSFTLQESKTITSLKYKPKETQGYSVKIFLNGEEKASFLDKILQFFERVQAFLPFLQSYSFEIHTKNTFPHGAGIASSASGISALALCLIKLEEKIAGSLDTDYALRKASFLSRLGSGSACRSIYNGLVFWGENEKISGANKRFAIPYPYEQHPVFRTFQDTILLIDTTEKVVNSTAGHGLMANHPFAEQRYQLAEKHISDLIPILREGDVVRFGQIVEQEALMLHALMMSSEKPFLLLKPNTLIGIERIWQFRKSHGVPVYFTLDAGANLHVLYPKEVERMVKSFIDADLKPLCGDNGLIQDQVKQ